MIKVALVTFVAVSGLYAHSAKADKDGCHMDYIKSNYHCHESEAQTIKKSSISFKKEAAKSKKKSHKHSHKHDHS